MRNPNSAIGKNLKQARDKRGFSLDKVAELTGVSKSMLGQIERGEASPTINTVWKIATGLKISFTALLAAPPAQAAVQRRAGLAATFDDGGYRLYPYFLQTPSRDFDISQVEVEPGAGLTAEGHGPGVEEFIIVTAGRLDVGAGGEIYHLECGDSLHFVADDQHSYRNPGDTLAVFSLVIYYRGLQDASEFFPPKN